MYNPGCTKMCTYLLMMRLAHYTCEDDEDDYEDDLHVVKTRESVWDCKATSLSQ